MQTRSVRRVGLVAAVALLAPLAPAARAADVYQTTIVQEDTPASPHDFVLTKPGNKIKIVSAKPKTGLIPSYPGMTLQLILKNVDCVLEGNDLGKAGKCGVAAHNPAPAAPVPAVLGLSVHTLGQDIFNVIGIPITFTKGVALFSNGKNKIDGTVFGSLISAVYGRTMGFHSPTVRVPGSAPSDCVQDNADCIGSMDPHACCTGAGAGTCDGTAPIAPLPGAQILPNPPFGVDGCLDGAIIGVGGILVGVGP